MLRSLYTAATGMYAQQLNLDNVSNNLANVNTTGFKKATVQFQDLMYQTLKEAGSATSEGTIRPTELTVGVGVKPVSTQKSFKPGTLLETGNPLDMAIAGDGFFQIADANGDVFFSRTGSFKITAEGDIVDASGRFLDPRITLPADTESLSITPDGIVLANIYGAVEAEEVGQIELARFVNPAGLKSIGGNLYQETTASGNPITGDPANDGFGSMEQGYLENSNVTLVEEMVNMIVAQRAYDVNSKMVKTSEAMIETANNLKR